MQLAKAEQNQQSQQAELKRLQEENYLFLKQVSEDFEELVFLRSMAQRLALGDRTHDIDELLAYMLPLLGKATGVQGMYYLEGTASGRPHMKKRWEADELRSACFEQAMLEDLVEHFAEDALAQPVVKNRMYESELYRKYLGIHELLLITVSTSMGPHEWILAVNRSLPTGTGDALSEGALLQNEFGTAEASIISTAAAMLASHAHNVAFLAERESLLVNTVRSLVSAIESKDKYTCGHSERVALYGRRLAEEVGYDEEECHRLYMTGLLHDLGKIGISDAVLKKNGALTPEEFAEIQKHPDLGWSILRELKQMAYVLPGVLHHHERVDGKGYPDQLERDEIPLDGKVLAIADAFDAMTSNRPYRDGMPVEKAIQIFKEGAGSQWDKGLVDSFLRILPDILAIKERYHRPILPARQTSKKALGEVISDSRTANCPPVCCSI